MHLLAMQSSNRTNVSLRLSMITTSKYDNYVYVQTRPMMCIAWFVCKTLDGVPYHIILQIHPSTIITPKYVICGKLYRYVFALLVCKTLDDVLYVSYYKITTLR